MSLRQSKKRKLDSGWTEPLINEWINTPSDQLLKNVNDKLTLILIMNKCEEIKKLIQQKLLTLECESKKSLSHSSSLPKKKSVANTKLAKISN